MAEKDISKRFAENVVYILKERRIPIGDFETGLDVSIGLLSRISNGCQQMNLPRAYEISKKLDMSIEDILRVDPVREELTKQLESCNAELDNITQRKELLLKKISQLETY